MGCLCKRTYWYPKRLLGVSAPIVLACANSGILSKYDSDFEVSQEHQQDLGAFVRKIEASLWHCAINSAHCQHACKIGTHVQRGEACVVRLQCYFHQSDVSH